MDSSWTLWLSYTVTGGRICSFSPCMEQVQRTCEMLTQHGFCDLTTLECLARPFSVHNVKLPPVDFGDQAENVTERESAAGRIAQISGDGTSLDVGSAPKAAKTDEDGGEKAAEKMDTDAQTSADDSKSKGSRQKTGSWNTQSGQGAKLRVQGPELKIGAPPVVMQGHTGFLTFASLY